MIPVLLSALLLPAPQGGGFAGPGENPAALDRSGVPWVLDFDEALRRARKDQRVLFVVPSTWQPTDDGDFGQVLENFRVRVLCDERVRRLVARRFVPYHCNVYEGAAAFDARAVAFIAREKKVFAKDTQVFHGGQPLLFMAPDGKLLEEVSTSDTADRVLEVMRELLAAHRRYGRRTKAEKQLEPLERAELELDLGHHRRAKRALRKAEGVAARLMEARVARAAGDWRAHRRIVQSLDAGERADDVRLERALALWHAGRFDELAELLEDFPEDSPRASEAAYHLGLAHFHRGETEKALATWKALVGRGEEDGWVYRADWAYCEAKLGPRETWAYGKMPAWPSLLGRRSYLGLPSPDLTRRRRR